MLQKVRRLVQVLKINVQLSEHPIALRGTINFQKNM